MNRPTSGFMNKTTHLIKKTISKGKSGFTNTKKTPQPKVGDSATNKNTPPPLPKTLSPKSSRHTGATNTKKTPLPKVTNNNTAKKNTPPPLSKKLDPASKRKSGFKVKIQAGVGGYDGTDRGFIGKPFAQKK